MTNAFLAPVKKPNAVVKPLAKLSLAAVRTDHFTLAISQLQQLTMLVSVQTYVTVILLMSKRSNKFEI
jgi:hypothetical protein